MRRRYYAGLLEEKLKQGAVETCQFSRVKDKFESTLEWYKEQVNFDNQLYFLELYNYL